MTGSKEELKEDHRAAIVLLIDLASWDQGRSNATSILNSQSVSNRNNRRIGYLRTGAGVRTHGRANGACNWSIDLTSSANASRSGSD